MKRLKVYDIVIAFLGGSLSVMHENITRNLILPHKCRVQIMVTMVTTLNHLSQVEHPVNTLLYVLIIPLSR